jgi:adenine-specific DNA-methyltransferase
MIKYLGSKRRLVPILASIAAASGARQALDLFTGTTRVAQAFKGLGLSVTAVDTARYSEAFARCYIELDAAAVDLSALRDVVAYLDDRPGRRGYVTETFCEHSRFFQPFNGERIDAVRDAIESEFAGSPLYPILLTSLIEAADRVDSTTGLQMAYVKQWSARSFAPLRLRVPVLLAGAGRAIRADARLAGPALGPVELAYLDPPYNQHRYFTNYHVWETLVAWDAPDHYGVACKRSDARDDETKSVFNSRRTMGEALRSLVRALDCELLVLSYNDEAWLSLEELESLCEHHESVRTLAIPSARYVGARIGIHNPAGERVGTVSHLSNTEYLVIAGSRATVKRVTAAASAASQVRPEPAAAVRAGTRR